MNSINKLFLFVLLIFLAGFNSVTKTTGANVNAQLEDVTGTVEVQAPVISEPLIEFANRQEILSTWYGPGFHGNLTTSGEIFDENALTAAHRTLPFGTLLRVTNLSNGKSVLVRVNDRGPVSTVFGLDLSKGAAKELAMIESGVAKVTIEQVILKQSKIPVTSLN